jgi:glycosyltransferase involved in cell wall biosynthesis
MFSVIIPVYNKVDCIGTTLNSVLSQTYTNFEIICVDDGSKDDSAAVIQQFNDSRVRLIQQTNAGVSAARNTGIAAAKGKWIAFLDADDWWHPNYLATLAELTIQYPNAQALATNYQSLADSADWQPSACTGLNQPAQVEIITNLPKAWLKNHSFCTISIAIQKGLLDRLQPCFMLGETQGEDLDLWFRVAEQTAIYVIHSKLAVYRTQQHDSLSLSQQLEHIPPFMQRLEVRAKSLQDTDYLFYVRKFIQKALLFNARKLFYRGQRLKAIKLILKANQPVSLQWLVYLISYCLLPSNIIKKII